MIACVDRLYCMQGYDVASSPLLTRPIERGLFHPTAETVRPIRETELFPLFSLPYNK
jgi:hypothetical protein